jgi:ankyrin repeat protein
LVFAGIAVREELMDTLLHMVALDKGSVVIAKLLVSKGANVNTKTNDGATPLHVAAAAGNVEVTKLLVSKGANVNAKTNDGQTPLAIAKAMPKPVVVRYLESVGGK